MFSGLLSVPGRFPVPFVPIDASGQSYFAEVGDAGQVENIVVSLLPPVMTNGVASLDQSLVASVFIASDLHPDEYRKVGSVSNVNPCRIFPIQWPSAEQGNVSSMKVGVFLEPIEHTAGVEPEVGTTKISVSTMSSINSQISEFVQKIAFDLHRFMQSFVQYDSSNEYLVLPPNALDRWLQRVLNKTAADPDFWRHMSTE